MEQETLPLIIYGHDFCTQAWWVRDALEKHAVPHEWRDIMQGDPAWKEELRALARGNLSVPTVLFPDGTVWVEPSPDRVLNKLGVERAKPGAGLMERLKEWLG